ncbi:MAG: hypothetical protein WC738_00950, partial [Candidatus Omnitrophota bacterium]
MKRMFAYITIILSLLTLSETKVLAGEGSYAYYLSGWIESKTLLTSDHWLTDSAVRYYVEFGPDNTWKQTIEYWLDDTTMHYQWLADVHSSVDGDDVYYEYDAAGNLTFKRLDTGE